MFLTPSAANAVWTNLQVDCLACLPELILCVAIVSLLFLRLFRGADHWHLWLEALAFVGLALTVSVVQWTKDSYRPRAFGGLLTVDNFTLFMRMFLLSFAALVIWLSKLTGIPDRDDSADFYCLLLGATFGMMIMSSANHLLMAYIGIEMASVPSYALAGFLKGKRKSSEAALKYVVYGGGASGIMLYGISLVAGKFGTGYLPDLAMVLGEATRTGVDAALLLGILFILIGLAFKLSAVPFHFWCPDVFEGAAAEVAAFLSVASKGAALALLGRLTLGMVWPLGIHSAELSGYLIPILAFFAAITATFGNLAAYPQTNLKRLLAYSTIAHAGYMMMGMATLTADGAGAVLFYLIAYLLMNLGAFAVVAFLRNVTGSEDLGSFRGLIYRCPVMVITLTVFMLSLLGMPPLAGFAAKFQIFSVLYDSAQQHGVAAMGLKGAAASREMTLSYTLYALLVIGGINTVFSAVYYLKVLKVMIIERTVEAVEGKESPPLQISAGSAFFASLMAALVLAVGIVWSTLADASYRGVDDFSKPQRTPIVAQQP